MEDMILNKITAMDAAIAAEVRAEFARQQKKTIAEFSRSAGIRRATVSSRVHGHVAMSPAELYCMAEYLNLSVSDFYSRAQASCKEKAHG